MDFQVELALAQVSPANTRASHLVALPALHGKDSQRLNYLFLVIYTKQIHVIIQDPSRTMGEFVKYELASIFHFESDRIEIRNKALPGESWESRLLRYLLQ